MTHEQHQNVSSLVSDLVQMAEATRRLPEVERQLADMRETARRDGDTIARLEIKLQQRSQELDELHAKLRSVEAERDDAGFRELEAQDKVNALRDAVESVLSSFGETLGVVDGTDRIRTVRMTEASRKEFLEWKARKEEEDRQAEEAAKRNAEAGFVEVTSAAPSYAYASDGTTSPGESDADPTVANTGISERPSNEPLTVPQSQGESLLQSQGDQLSIGSEGQSDPRPIGGDARSTGDILLTDVIVTAAERPSDVPMAKPSGQSEVPPPASASPDVANFTSATSSDGANSPGRYSGKKYRDHPYYVSEASWLANGGTLEDYYYPQAVPAA